VTELEFGRDYVATTAQLVLSSEAGSYSSIFWLRVFLLLWSEMLHRVL